MEETNVNYIKRELEICIDMLNRSGDNTKQQVKYKLECLIEELKNE